MKNLKKLKFHKNFLKIMKQIIYIKNCFLLKNVKTDINFGKVEHVYLILLLLFLI